jgi:hypothetical protein
MLHAHLAEQGFTYATSLPSPAYTSSLPALPAPLLIRACSVRSAGLCALGATSVCYLAGAGGAGAIRSRSHRCARVARGRGSRLAPPVPGRLQPPYGGPWRSATTVGCCGRATASCAWQAVAATTMSTARALRGPAAGARSAGATVAASAASAVCATIAGCARRPRSRGVLYVSVRTCVGTPHPLSVRLRCVD